MNEITYPHEVVCSPQVLQSVTDECLVRTCQRGTVAIRISGTDAHTCQRGTVAIRTSEADAHTSEEDAYTSDDPVVSFDAAQLELCRRYEPLILKYAHLSSYMQIQDDVESFLWVLFMESIYSYDTDESVPFAGYVKSAIHYGQINFFKHITRTWNHEITVPPTVDDDVEDMAMDKFPDESTKRKDILDTEEAFQLQQKLRKACQSLPVEQQDLLRRIYLEHARLSDLAAMWHTSKQAIQQRHQRALKRLRCYLTH